MNVWTGLRFLKRRNIRLAALTRIEISWCKHFLERERDSSIAEDKSVPWLQPDGKKSSKIFQYKEFDVPWIKRRFLTAVLIMRRSKEMFLCSHRKLWQNHFSEAFWGIDACGHYVHFNFIDSKFLLTDARCFPAGSSDEQYWSLEYRHVQLSCQARAALTAMVQRSAQHTSNSLTD